MSDVIDLCSDDGLRSNGRFEKQESLPVSLPVHCQQDAAIKAEDIKQQEKEEPTLADGIPIDQLPDVHRHRYRRRHKRRHRHAPAQPTNERDPFADDELLTEFRTQIADAQQHVQRCHDELTAATTRLQTLEDALSERLRHLRREADAAFNWLTEFPWDESLSHQLQYVFHISSFRPLQREALNATLSKRDVFAILPTGAGKSLLYQLAAVVDGGLTLVVTPLIALSLDQRAALRRLNIRAESLDSTTDKALVKKIYNDLLPSNGRVPGSSHPRKKRRGKLSSGWMRDDMDPAILFVTPEQIAKSKRLMARLEDMHEMGHVSRICVDEAHCASSWGHDFRVEYRKLGILRRQLPDAPILALSATCSPGMTEDVCRMLETSDCVVFRGSVDRPNLFYEVREKRGDDDGVVDDLARWIGGEFAGMCGIVYVLAKKDAVSYAEGLCRRGVAAGCYHGDMEAEERIGIHERWSDGRLLVVVATIAFGLGIDNAHVRFVIHATMATSVEGYYQESGRAGRDGKAAKCILLHRAREFPRLSGFVADKGGDRLQKMYEMYRYASAGWRGAGCRRALIARAFGEGAPRRAADAAETCCDTCRAGATGVETGFVAVDVTELARSALRMLRAAGAARPDEKRTLLGVATDWSNTGPKGRRLRGGERAIARGVSVDVRLEILVAMVLRGWLAEFHRHSSYAVNAYVTAGDSADAGAGDVRVAVPRAAAERLVAAGGRLVDAAAPDAGGAAKKENGGEGSGGAAKKEAGGEGSGDAAREDGVESDDDVVVRRKRARAA